MDNRTIARRLREYARYLERQADNLYRVKAYRQAAAIVESYSQPVEDLLKSGGRACLEALPGIGDHLSYTIEELVKTGEFHTVHSPREFLAPKRIEASLPYGLTGLTMIPNRSPDSLFSPTG
jgi:DNA polymerase/3'-5' exonuclease PolX